MTDVEDSKMTSDCKAGWMPIETAPRDGTPILVYEPSNVPGPDNFSLVTWFTWNDGTGGKWQLAECGSYAADGDTMNDDPTHWMPLPPPPNND